MGEDGDGEGGAAIDGCDNNGKGGLDGDMEGATKSRLAEKEEGRKGMLGAVVDKNEGGFCVFWGKGLED